MIYKKRLTTQSNRRTYSSRILLVLIIFFSLLLNQLLPASYLDKEVAANGQTELYLPLLLTPPAPTFIYLPIISTSRPETPFGVESNQSLLSGSLMMTRANDLHIGWTRLNGSQRISWADLQPVEDGAILWQQLSNFENELRSLKSKQIKPIVIIDDYPYWATIEANSCSAIQEAKFKDFATFARALVERYKAFGVYNWELGNEPDIDPSLVEQDSVFGCWGDIDDPYYGGAYYGQMLKVVGKAIKDADPSAKVWIGGLLLNSPNTTTPGHGKPELFLQGILEAGAADYFDVVPYHSYPPYVNRRVDHDNNIGGPWDAWGGGFVGKATFLRQMMANYGVHKELFLNEAGMMCPSYYAWCTPTPSADFYQAQADLIVRGFVRTIANDIQGAIWYTLNTGWRYTGLLDSDGNPLPVYYAYQVLNELLAGSSYKEAAFYAEGIEAYAFLKRGEQIDVVWAKEDQVFDILIPQNKFVRAYNQYGNSLTPLPIDSNYRLSVGFEPIYIVRVP